MIRKARTKSLLAPLAKHSVLPEAAAGYPLSKRTISNCQQYYLAREVTVSVQMGIGPSYKEQSKEMRK
jgi:hypothetical protein